jgi:Ca2+-transporting ATPase
VQTETDKVVKMIAAASLAVALLLTIFYGASRHDWLNGILVGITFAMALIPEELPVVLALFLGLGAWRIARQRVLTRRVPAIEMLGETTVLCVDKTGTLTQIKWRSRACSRKAATMPSSPAMNSLRNWRRISRGTGIRDSGQSSLAV